MKHEHQPPHSSSASIAIVTAAAVLLVTAITVGVAVWQTAIRYP
jgi:hypothetical protein